jgi:hypothetical protein
MSKIQTIICLLIFIVVLFSMDMIFGNPLKETFSGVSWNKGLGVGISKSGLGQGTGIGGVGSTLDYRPVIQQNQLNANVLYDSPSAILGATPLNNYIKSQSDDQPLHFSFPF